MKQTYATGWRPGRRSLLGAGIALAGAAILFVLAFILVRRQARHDRYINNYDAEYL